MARYVSNRDSDGKTDENGHFRLPLKLVEGEILEGLELQAQSSPSMEITVTAGEARIPYADYAYAAWATTNENITIPTASTSGSRIDRVVAYIDRSLTYTSSDVNHPNGMKYAVVAGTVSQHPTAPTDSQVTNAVNGNPWIDLGRVSVQRNTTMISSTDISATGRKPMKVSSSVGVSSFAMADGSLAQLTVIKEGDPFPAPGDVPIIVLVARD